MVDISVATLTPKDVKNLDGTAGGINPNSENSIAVFARKKLIFFRGQGIPPSPNEDAGRHGGLLWRPEWI
jgi:hypothetical protein